MPLLAAIRRSVKRKSLISLGIGFFSRSQGPVIWAWGRGRCSGNGESRSPLTAIRCSCNRCAKGSRSRQWNPQKIRHRLRASRRMSYPPERPGSADRPWHCGESLFRRAPARCFPYGLRNWQRPGYVRVSPASGLSQQLLQPSTFRQPPPRMYDARYHASS